MNTANGLLLFFKEKVEEKGNLFDFYSKIKSEYNHVLNIYHK